jgi:superfamily II DNA or RNA helicase
MTAGWDWRTFEEARKHARGLGLKSAREWEDWRKRGDRPADIPATPNDVYKGKGWAGWGDWLGTGNTREGEYRSFEQARELVRGRGLKNVREWEEWCKRGDRPADIPSNPQRRYKNKGWAGWGDWLGTGTFSSRHRKLLPFEEARECARGLKLRNQGEWREWVKTGEKPADIPANPDSAYKDEGWVGWGDWLGTGRKPPGDEWRPFEEARKFARGWGLDNSKEWRELVKTGEKPADIPANPDSVYKAEWRGWADWLGYAPGNWTRAPLLALLEDLRPRLPYLAERELYAILAQGGAMPALVRRFGADSPLRVLEDLRENEGRGVEAAVVAAAEEEPEPEDESAADEVVSGDVAEVAGDAARDLPAPEAFDQDALPEIATGEGLRAVDDLAGIPGGLDHETAEYLVGNRVAALWDMLVNERGEEISRALEGEGGHYFRLIRERFESERREVENLPVPAGWSFGANGSGVLPPNAMQKRTAYAVLTKKRVGNWSGPGAGKTNAAILAARVAGCRNVLVVAANSTLAGWRDAITNAFPDSIVHTTPAPPAPGRFNYTVVNYEKFQQPDRAALARRLRDLAYDFVVLDEVQMVKQRDADKGQRRETLESVICALAEDNPDLRVLGMSATPVINNLYEGRKLLEIVAGRSFGDLETRPTVSNALALHRALMVYGFRYRPRYEIEFDKPEVVEEVRNDLADALRAARGVLAVEQTLLPAKLEAIRPFVRRGTLVYTHYVEGMVYPARRFFEAMELHVGCYTGGDKTGLEEFKAGRVDVLIGSQPVSTGVDGLQKICNRIVVLSPPWTGAEYEQLLGRVRRQGSAFDRVELVWPQVVLERGDAGRWSWDARRQRVIEYKRTLSDCAVDGNVPEALAIRPVTLLGKSREALEEWIARVSEEEGDGSRERPRLRVPLPPPLRERARVAYGDFSAINNRWTNSASATVHERLKDDPSEWYLYHTLYREARAGWEEVPAEHVASQLRGRPGLIVGDFGCGECLLRDALEGESVEVRGFDHVAADETVTACDVAHTPQKDGVLDAAVFSLSLMGRNWPEYLAEAHRTLKPYGLLCVAEPARRWTGDALERAIEEGTLFRVLESYQRGDFRYVVAAKARA